MITSYLQGGLGNQLFQISAAYNLAKLHQDTAEFNFNYSNTPNQGNQSNKYKLNIYKFFNHNENIQANTIYKPPCPYELYKEPRYGYEKIPYTENLMIVGYFQSEKYFLETKDDLIQKFRNGLKLEVKKYATVKKFVENKGLLTTIHIRRGDYQSNPEYHNLCSEDYYKIAIDLVKKKFPASKFLVVSDDKEWCSLHTKLELSPFTDELEDFILMMLSNHNIIANSSFSWWATYLNQSVDKLTIAPSVWFGSRGPQDQEDIVPSNWIKI